MRILIIGAHGTLGQAITRELSNHELVTAGRSNGDLRVDIKDADSVARMYREAGPLDAVVIAAGGGVMAPLAEFTVEQYRASFNDKLLGQVNVVLAGQHVLNDGGSFTLTSGILSHEPIPLGSAMTMGSAAIDAFAVAAAIELPRGLRINVVSPGMLVESLPVYGDYLRGFEPVPAARAALAFRRSVEGRDTGRVYRVY
ncbi:short chain dehydrogenase [Chitinolyticbacter meiyuanensis]|uniref:short chain dehydrogenase n=1 Tax=Chitinolyticbacter meiyuanensis TaxID=682798 RepID=UPI0011E5FE54|nr:short chain dehydrogenase [Chitinolyticbacter meiyuanensis]